MARIIYSGLVTSIKGSVGGTTFQSNAYGNTVKNKPNMVIPNTVEQEQRKLIFSKATKAWATLTDAERSNWDTYANTFPQYAKNNPSSQLSGYAVFTKWHAALFLGLGLLSDIDANPSLVAVPLDTVTVKVIVAGGVMSLDLDFALGDNTYYVNVFISRPFPASKNFAGSSLRFLVNTENEDIVIPVTALYTSLFGTLPTVGQSVQVGLQFFVQAGGKVLATSVQRITVTAS